MATNPNPTSPTSVSGKILKLSTQAQKNAVNFVKAALVVHNRQEELQNKMDAIDVAYARYKASVSNSTSSDGIDRGASDTGCGNIFAEDDVTPPIVVSQVDSYVAYLADVFLSGSPLFPVVSNPGNKVFAEQLETLMDDHASLGGYARQLLLFLRNGIKYNYCAVEASWEEIEQFSVAGDYTTGTGQSIQRSSKGFTSIKNLNMRNVFRDTTIDPGDVSASGDYAGYIEQVSRMRLKKELNKLSKKSQVYNADLALDSIGSPNGVSGGSTGNNYYRNDPSISNYVNPASRGQTSGNGLDWDAWFDGKSTAGTSRNYGTSYQRVVTYARILPSDFGITAPQPNTPQIWKFILINEILISAERIISAYDYLPILFGQPMEDGMGVQTQSVAEGEIPFQKAATTLFNIRFAAARRAVSDRAIYDTEGLSAKDVNSTAAAPKIPARLSVLSKKTLSDLYHPIPFDARGTDGTIQDAQTIVGFSKELHGLNAPKQGQFQKGNKSVTEWNDTMAGSDNRLRMPALILEHQFFAPLKSLIVLNIYQYGDNSVVVSQKSGQVLKIDLVKLREQVLAFRIADGYTPKSKLASVEAITSGLQMIATSPILQQAYGSNIPGMFAHLMQLTGVRGLEEYDPVYQAPGNAAAPPAAPVVPPIHPMAPTGMPAPGMLP